MRKKLTLTAGIFTALVSVYFIVSGFTQNKEQKKGSAAEIKWMTVEEAVAASQKEPRKILLDVYTSWCGWCKKLDNVTYKDPEVVKYINSHYYAVKLNAETSDTIKFAGRDFVNERPGVNRSSHQFAIALLDGQMSYPSTVILDETLNRTNPPIKGYMEPAQMLPILKFFGDNAYKNTSWEDYQKQTAN